MRINSLSFGPTVRAPALRGPGVALTVARGQERGPVLVIQGTCRANKAELPQGKLALPANVLLVGVHLPTQFAATVNLVGAERLLFDEDVEQEGDDFVARFRCELDPSTSMPGSFCLHASFRQYVSDILWVTL